MLLQWATWVIYNVPPGDSFTQQEREKQTRYIFEATREILHLLLKNKNETDRFCESWWWGRNLRSRTFSITFLQMRARTFSIAFSGFTSENPLKAGMAVIDEQNRKKRKVFTIIISRSGTYRNIFMFSCIGKVYKHSTYNGNNKHKGINCYLEIHSFCISLLLSSELFFFSHKLECMCISCLVLL